jgi:hypothetical protein
MKLSAKAAYGEKFQIFLWSVRVGSGKKMKK